MNQIEMLKNLQAKATPGPWTEGTYGLPVPWESVFGTYYAPRCVSFETNHGDVPVQSEENRSNLQLCEALRNLAPELIELWEAVEAHGGCPCCDTDSQETYDRILEARDALRSKAAEVLK